MIHNNCYVKSVSKQFGYFDDHDYQAVKASGADLWLSQYSGLTGLHFPSQKSSSRTRFAVVIMVVPESHQDTNWSMFSQFGEIGLYEPLLLRLVPPHMSHPPLRPQYPTSCTRKDLLTPKGSGVDVAAFWATKCKFNLL